jgi:hypothetical protein
MKRWLRVNGGAGAVGPGGGGGGGGGAAAVYRLTLVNGVQTVTYPAPTVDGTMLFVILTQPAVGSGLIVWDSMFSADTPVSIPVMAPNRAKFLFVAASSIWEYSGAASI